MVRKEKKGELVDQLSQKLSRAEIVIATDYRGMTVAEMSELRRKLRDQGVEYRVVKNTLARFAATGTQRNSLVTLLDGPTALAFGYDDVVQVAKTLRDFKKSSGTALRIKGGLLSDRVLSVDDVGTIAKLPSREELIAKVIGLTQSPLTRLVTVLNGNVQGLVGVLQARVRQLEGG